MKTDKILVAHQLLSVADFSNLSSSERIKNAKRIRALRPVAEEAEKSKKEAETALMPDVLKKLREGQMSFDTMSDEEKSKAEMDLQRYERELTLALADVMDKEESVAVEPMSAEDFSKLLDTNTKWNTAQVDVLMEVLGVEI